VWKSKTPRTLKARKLLILGSTRTIKKRRIGQVRYVYATRLRPSTQSLPSSSSETALYDRRTCTIGEHEPQLFVGTRHGSGSEATLKHYVEIEEKTKAAALQSLPRKIKKVR